MNADIDAYEQLYKNGNFIVLEELLSKATEDCIPEEYLDDLDTQLPDVPIDQLFALIREEAGFRRQLLIEYLLQQILLMNISSEVFIEHTS